MALLLSYIQLLSRFEAELKVLLFDGDANDDTRSTMVLDSNNTIGVLLVVEYRLIQTQDELESDSIRSQLTPSTNSMQKMKGVVSVSQTTFGAKTLHNF